MEVPLLDLRPIHQPLAGRMREAVVRVLESNRFIGGPELEAFENETAAYCGAKYALGVSSGTDAIIVSLMALDISYGDEVIVPSFTFFATAGSVHRVGAKPVFCDISPDTFNMDPTKLEALITARTKAIIPVHLFGQCADMDAILDVARRHSLKVIEDAAQAMGARYRDSMAGSMGDTGCFSFFPSKNLGGIGDGGLVTTNDADLAAAIRSLRDHGAQRRYYHSRVGGNFRLDAIQAAALRVKLPALEDWHDQRRRNAAFYKEALSDLQEAGHLRLPVEAPYASHVFNQFVIRVKQRDRLQKHLMANRIGEAVYYPVPLHLQDCFSDLGVKEGALPESEAASREVLALPIFPGLTDRQTAKVVRCLRDFYLSAS
ncbi:MAG: DegT/DnrJ/EryC1/StrS family aminotransferase [Desulfomonile tiedjei]|nr:DegT/DnrJ/EryC1/StrS family aminotransferase [Desulfomonile tiedjei]